MKLRLRFSSFILCIAVLTLFSSCSTPGGKNRYSAESFEYFDTVTTIVGYEDSKREFDAVADMIFARLEEYHRLYSIYEKFDGANNLCALNETTGSEARAVSVDRRITDMLQYAKEMFELSGGEVNVAMGSVLSIWHECREIGMNDPENATLPSRESLLAADEHTDISMVIIDDENSAVTIKDPLMKLDVGAIAKGYAVEQIARFLEEKGITGYVLNVGGNVRAIGGKTDGTNWTVGIENPLGGDYLAYIEISGMSVVTSGSYQRYYYVDGKRYHHIIDPDTLFPAEGFLSVSVVCRDSGLGDALSTALFCMTEEEGIELVESLSEVEAMWVKEDGSKTVSSGWGRFEKNK